MHFFQEIEKANNLAATLLSNNDVTTGIKSQVQALGSGNPFTIKTTGNTVSSVTVQGGRGFAISSYDKKKSKNKHTNEFCGICSCLIKPYKHVS